MSGKPVVVYFTILLADKGEALRPTLKLARGLPSRRSQTSSAKRFLQRELFVRSSSFNISGVIEMSVAVASSDDPQAKLLQITCLYDMDIPRPDNFNETYLYEGMSIRFRHKYHVNKEQNSWNATWLPSSALASR